MAFNRFRSGDKIGDCQICCNYSVVWEYHDIFVCASCRGRLGAFNGDLDFFRKYLEGKVVTEMAAKKHTHKYHRINVNSNQIWACALPDCSHFMPKHLESTVKGKQSLCWNCGEKFELDLVLMRQTKPTCYECNDQASSLTDAIEKLGIQPPK